MTFSEHKDSFFIEKAEDKMIIFLAHTPINKSKKRYYPALSARALI